MAQSLEENLGHETFKNSKNPRVILQLIKNILEERPNSPTKFKELQLLASSLRNLFIQCSSNRFYSNSKSRSYFDGFSEECNLWIDKIGIDNIKNNEKSLIALFMKSPTLKIFESICVFGEIQNISEILLCTINEIYFKTNSEGKAICSLPDLNEKFIKDHMKILMINKNEISVNLIVWSDLNNGKDDLIISLFNHQLKLFLEHRSQIINFEAQWENSLGFLMSKYPMNPLFSAIIDDLYKLSKKIALNIAIQRCNAMKTKVKDFQSEMIDFLKKLKSYYYRNQRIYDWKEYKAQLAIFFNKIFSPHHAFMISFESL
jgi:hypothetical protein